MATPKDFYVPIDMHGLEVLNHRLHILSSDPGTPNDGEIWFNSTLDEPRVRTTRGSTAANRALIGDDDDFHNRLSLEATNNDADEILVWDASATPIDHEDRYVRMTRANFLSGVGTVQNAYYRMTVDSGTTNLDATGEEAIVLSGDGSILQTVGSTPGTNTIEITWLTQTANLIFAGPSSGGAAAPTFRALVDLDMPTSYDATNWDTAYTHSTLTTGNPHSVALSDFGLTLVTTLGDPGSDTNIVSEAAIRSAIGTAVAGGVVYKGGYDANTDTPALEGTPGPLGILTGWMYTVTADGTFFTEAVQTGDVLIAENDAPTTLAEWTIVERNIASGFLSLTDTPASYAASGGFMVMVDSTPDALEFVDPSGYALSNFSNDLSALTQTSNGGLETFSYNGSAAETLTLDFTNLTNETTLADADEFAYYDSGVGMRALLYSALKTGLNTDGFVLEGGSPGNNHIAIWTTGTSTIDGDETLQWNTAANTLILQRLAYDDATAPAIHFYKERLTGQTGSAADGLYRISSSFYNSTPALIEGSRISSTLVTATASSEDVDWKLDVRIGGSLTNYIDIDEVGMKLPALAGDEAETYLVAIDNSTGLLTKRSVASVAGGSGDVSWGSETGLQPIVFGANAGDIDSENTLAYNPSNFTLTLDSLSAADSILKVVYNSTFSIGLRANSFSGILSATDILYLTPTGTGSRIGVGDGADPAVFFYIHDSNATPLTSLLRLTDDSTTATLFDVRQNGTVYIPGLGADEAETYVVAIDNSSGLLTKRSVSSIAGAAGDVSWGTEAGVQPLVFGETAGDIDSSALLTWNGSTGIDLKVSTTTYTTVATGTVGFFHIAEGAYAGMQLNTYSNTALYAGSTSYYRYGGTIGATAAAPTNAIAMQDFYLVYDGTSSPIAGYYSFEVDGAVATGDFDTHFKWALKEGAAAYAVVATLGVNGFLTAAGIDIESGQNFITDSGTYDAGDWTTSNYMRVASTYIEMVATSPRLSISPSVADGASAVAFFLRTSNSLTTAGAKLVSIWNTGSEMFFVDKDGNVDIEAGAEYRVDGVAIGGGATTFVGLSDTPANFTSAENKLVIVNGTPDALIFSSVADLTTITDIADTDLFMVELAAGGLRDITWTSLKTEMWEDHSIGDHSEVTITSAADNHLLVYDSSGATVVNKKAKYVEVIAGDDVETDFDVVHGLGTEDIVVQVWAETGDDMITPSITKTSGSTTTTVTIGFSTAPATGTDYKVVVYGWEG